MNSLISKQEKYIQQIKNYIAHTIKGQGKKLSQSRDPLILDTRKSCCIQKMEGGN